MTLLPQQVLALLRIGLEEETDLSGGVDGHALRMHEGCDQGVIPMKSAGQRARPRRESGYQAPPAQTDLPALVLAEPPKNDTGTLSQRVAGRGGEARESTISPGRKPDSRGGQFISPTDRALLLLTLPPEQSL